MGSSAKTFVLPFVKKEQVAKDIFSFYFDRSSSNFDFLPGQYIRISLPHTHADDRGTTRFFTISSSPLEKHYLIITTRISSVPSSFKKLFTGLKKDDYVELFGPMGKFYLTDEENGPLVFLSGGMGITPFHSMIQYAATKQLKVPITLIASFLTIDEGVFSKTLTGIARMHTNIQVHYLFSNGTEFQNNKKQEMIKKIVSGIQYNHYYIVGPPRMVEETKILLAEMGIDEEKILSEDFTGYP